MGKKKPGLTNEQHLELAKELNLCKIRHSHIWFNIKIIGISSKATKLIEILAETPLTSRVVIVLIILHPITKANDQASIIRQGYC